MHHEGLTAQNSQHRCSPSISAMRSSSSSIMPAYSSSSSWPVASSVSVSFFFLPLPLSAAFAVLLDLLFDAEPGVSLASLSLSALAAALLLDALPADALVVSTSASDALRLRSGFVVLVEAVLVAFADLPAAWKRHNVAISPDSHKWTTRRQCAPFLHRLYCER